MSGFAHRFSAVPLFCVLCVFVQLLFLPLFRLPLPLAWEDVFLGDWVLSAFPLRAAELKLGEVWRIFSYALVHGSWWHLLGNLLGLWITGRALEALLGWRSTALLVLMGAAAGAAGFLASLLLDPRLSPEMTCLGASAILTTLIGTATGLALRGEITLWVILLPLRLRGYWLIPLMITLFILEGTFLQIGTAYGAHLGGWLAGLLAAPLLTPRH
jgi:membrane associated rhomboid family serine protease